MTSRRGSSRGALLLVLSALAATGALLVGPAQPARADDLVSFQISTAARAAQVFQDDGSGARSAEVDVPETTADLTSGPSGRAFSSIVWPGPLVGNLGTLVRVLQPSLPESVSALNDPVRAEATMGQAPPTVSFDLPNVSMTATATEQLVEARATIGTVTGEAGPTNGFTTFGSARLQSGLPHGTASASASGLSFAGGLVKIGAVTSTATATSDGVKGSGSASTEIVGLEIAGVRVGVDDKGLHLADTATPLDAVVHQVVDQALSAAGVELSVGVPTTTVVGPSVTATAPALVVTIKVPSGVIGLVLGGAQATVSGLTSDAPPTESPAPSGVVPSDGGSFGGVPTGVSPSFPSPAAPTYSAPAGEAVGIGGAVPIVDDRHRIRGAQVALALASALLLAGGLGQLFQSTIGRRGVHCPEAAGAP
jgi:hypothetical protein